MSAESNGQLAGTVLGGGAGLFLGGPMGAAVGAGLGGALGGTIGGWFGKKKKVAAPPQERVYMGGSGLAEQRYLSELGGGEYNAFQAAEEAQRQANEARGLENQVFGEYGALDQQFGALDQQYADLAAGRGPSLGRQMAMQGANTAQMQANQLAAGARGGGGHRGGHAPARAERRDVQGTRPSGD